MKNTRKRQKSGMKHKHAIEWYIDILKKEQAQGETKWIIKTKPKAIARIKKYGLTANQVQSALTHKGLKDLSSKVAL